MNRANRGSTLYSEARHETFVIAWNANVIRAFNINRNDRNRKGVAMRRKFKLAISSIAIAALAAFAMRVLQAQTKPPGYFIAEVDVTDSESFSKDYSAKVPATVQPFGGHWLVRGGKAIGTDGEPPKSRIVVMAFDSVEKAQAWRDSPGYKALVPIRDKAAKVRSFIVEGVAP
jgi:uncharacterized protein (DUF1330 family)